MQKITPWLWFDWLFSKWPEMSNDFKALNRVSILLKINILHHKKAPIHPFNA